MSYEQREESVPLYPPFVEKYPTWRRLACWEDGQLLTETGETYSCSTYNDFIDCLFTLKLLLFVPALVTFKYLDDLINDTEHAKVMAENKSLGQTKNPRPINARIKKGRETRWIVEYKRWPVPLSGLSFLKTMREAYAHCGVGTPSTPAGLGQALMRKSWHDQYGEDWVEHRHSVPSVMASNFLREHLTGGRVDTPGIGKTFDTLLELDMTNAYAAHYMRHPTGTAISMSGFGSWPHSFDDGTWFARCEVVIKRELALGPFPVRSIHNGEERIIYPTQPGSYACFLWAEQARDCVELGCNIRVAAGYGWHLWTTDNAAWVALVEHLRATASSTYVGSCIKAAIVSGIGRHGMGDTLSYIVSENSAPERATYTVGPGGAYAYFVVQEQLRRQANMTHWFAYTLMQCARSLFWFALPYAQAERLEATNYDAIYISGDTSLEKDIYPDHTGERKTGQWRREELTGVAIPAPRSIISTQKTRRPGVKRDARKASSDE